MKAIFCEKHGPPSDLVLNDVPSPVPSEQEVLVSVKACAINFPDTLTIQGTYQFKPDLPFSPGSDISGVVKAVGSEVTKWKIGDEVFGLVQYGGLAEELCIHQDAIFKKLPEVDFPTAASLTYTYGTAYYALNQRAKLQSNETLVVLGASGGVGLAAVQLGKAMGARVIACASTQNKLGLCKSNGADDLINYEAEDFKLRIKELTEGRGADVILDTVGDGYTESALRASAWNGRFLIVGFAGGNIPRIPMNLPLLKGCSIVGVFWSRFRKEQPTIYKKNVDDIIQFCIGGKISPHIHKTYPLSDTPLALEDMMNRTVMGKVVVVL